MGIKNTIFEMLEDAKNTGLASMFGEAVEGWFLDSGAVMEEVINVLQTDYYLDVISDSLLGYSQDDNIRTDLLPEVGVDIFIQYSDDIVHMAETCGWRVTEEDIA